MNICWFLAWCVSSRGVATGSAREACSASGSLLLQHASRLQKETAASVQAEQDFTVVFIPDTQFMVLNVGYAGAHLHEWIAQADWIVEKKSALNIKAVIHVGDIVEEAHRDHEWQNFFQGWDKIEALGLPWSAVPGNHDLNNMGQPFASNRWDFYNQQMTPAFQRNPGFASSFPPGKYENSVVFFEAAGIEFMVVGIELGPTPESLAWASEQLNKNLNKRAIINNHFVLWGAERGIDIASWAKKHRNIFMIQQGHDCAREWNRVIYNDWNEPIQEILTDYQCTGDAFLRYYTFRVVENRVDAYTYSPAEMRFETDANSQWSFGFDMDPAAGNPSPSPTLAPAPTPSPVQADTCFEALDGLASSEGNGVGELQTLSLAACKEACARNDQCNSLAFCPEYGGCWFKDRSFGGGEATTTKADCKTYYKKPCNGGTAPATSTSMPTGAGCASYQSWPDVDSGVTCNDCTALVFTTPTRGRCDEYCQSFGHICIAAAEEEADNCQVKERKLCSEEIQGTSDMLCTCKYPSSASSGTTTGSSDGQSTSTTNTIISTSVTGTSTPFAPVDGGEGRACRGASASDNDASYYVLLTGVSSLDDCKAKCMTETACSGIEYSSNGRCEVWTRPAGIEASAAVAGYTCLAYGIPSISTSAFPSSSLPTTTLVNETLFAPVDGGAGRACRGASASDSDDSYYLLFRGVSSLDDCKAKCMTETACTGIEYNSNGRCEVWTRPAGIEASAAVAGYTCLAYGIPGTLVESSSSTMPPAISTSPISATTSISSAASRRVVGVNVFGSDGFESDDALRTAVRSLLKNGVRHFRIVNVGAWQDATLKAVDDEAGSLSITDASVQITSMFFDSPSSCSSLPAWMDFSLASTRSKLQSLKHIARILIQLDTCSICQDSTLYCVNPTEQAMQGRRAFVEDDGSSGYGPAHLRAAHEALPAEVEFVIPYMSEAASPDDLVQGLVQRHVAPLQEAGRKFHLEGTFYPFWTSKEQVFAPFPVDYISSFMQKSSLLGFDGFIVAETGWPRACPKAALGSTRPATLENMCKYFESVLADAHELVAGQGTLDLLVYHWKFGPADDGSCGGANTWGLFQSDGSFVCSGAIAGWS